MLFLVVDYHENMLGISKLLLKPSTSITIQMNWCLALF